VIVGICEWCNKYKRLTRHHTKYRTGEKVCHIDTIQKIRIYTIQYLCRSCHDVMEQDYILLGRVVDEPSVKYIPESPELVPKPSLYFALKFIKNPPRKKRNSRGRKIIKNLYNIALKNDTHEEEVNLIMQIQNIIRY